MPLLSSVRDYITAQRMLRAGQIVVVGVSGGPDSLALLHLLHRLTEPLALRLHVAHLHHGIRGAEADADAEYVTQFAAHLGWPCTVERVDVPAVAAREKWALEEASRRVRYAFLSRVAQAEGSQVVAVAHNADDQAETVLMHFLRGAGPTGLRGMLPVTPLQDYRLLPGVMPPPGLRLIRPLLTTPRAEITAYCRTHHLQPRFDRSNLDTTFFRNRLRHEVLPYLAAINPRISQRLRHLAEVVRAEAEVLEHLVDQAWSTLLQAARDDALTFDLAGWRAQPLAIRRAMVRRAAYHLRRTLRDVDFVHVEQAIRVAQHGRTGAQATLPRRLLLTVGYRTLTLHTAEARHLPPDRPWLEPGQRIRLAVPGIMPLPGGWRVQTEVRRSWELDAIAHNDDPLSAWLDAHAAQDLALRTRRPGDRITLQGLGGASTKLSDVLTNKKIPRAWRDFLPILVSERQILWIVGYHLSEAALVRPTTERVLHLRFLPPEVPRAG